MPKFTRRRECLKAEQRAEMRGRQNRVKPEKERVIRPYFTTWLNLVWPYNQGIVRGTGNRDPGWGQPYGLL